MYGNAVFATGLSTLLSIFIVLAMYAAREGIVATYDSSRRRFWMLFVFTFGAGTGLLMAYVSLQPKSDLGAFLYAGSLLGLTAAFHLVATKEFMKTPAASGGGGPPGATSRGAKAVYVTYQQRKNELEQLVAELREMLKYGPRAKDQIRRAVDIAMLEVLAVAVAITDKPEHDLSSNFMEFVEEDGKLVMTHALGMYARIRLFREFPVGKTEGGSCGLAWETGKILTISDTSRPPPGVEMSFYPVEERMLNGVVNIPVKLEDQAHGGVLNIDSPARGVLTEDLRMRAGELQACMHDVLSLRQELQKL